MRFLRDTTWILIGILLGTAACFLLTNRLVLFAPVDVVSLAGLAVFLMLLGSLADPWRPAAVVR